MDGSMINLDSDPYVLKRVNLRCIYISRALGRIERGRSPTYIEISKIDLEGSTSTFSST